MKTTDSVMREKFEQYMSNGFHEHALRFPEAENTQFESGFDVSQEIAEKFISHSLAEARREVEMIETLNKHSTTNWEIIFHGKYVDINYPDSPVTPDYEDYLTLGEALKEVELDLLTGDNPERKV